MHSVTLPFALTNGNEGRTKTYWKPARFRKQVEAELMLTGHSRRPWPMPVVVHVTRILGPRQSKFDADSLQRGNLKEVIDSLVTVGWFVDDGPKWIIECRCFQDDENRADGPAIRIEVFDAATT